MKFIFNNQYIRVYKFNTLIELDKFISHQNVNNLQLNSLNDRYLFCYIIYDSLTEKKIFAFTFSSESEEESLNFLFWQEESLSVIECGASLFLVNPDFTVRKEIEILSPLIGLYIIDRYKLLILEEVQCTIIDTKGKVLKRELFDLINEFDLIDNCLFIKTDEEERKIRLE